MTLLDSTLAAIEPASDQAVEAARAHNLELTKPLGSAGLLEDTAIRLAGAYHAFPPPLPDPVAVVIFAGDHGVCAQGVSPYPQEVTVQMMLNFASGGACINALARQFAGDVTVVAVGVAADLPQGAPVEDRRVARGTADLSVGPAMTVDQAREAVEVGIAVANERIDAGYRLLLAGDMGIGNTTPSAALVAALTGLGPAEVTGRGTGINDEAWQRKVAAITAGLEVNGLPDADVPALKVLARVGGYEHAAMVGFYLAAAARHVPVVLDGIISVSAALVACAMAPAAKDYMVAGHRSAEPGAGHGLAALGLEPLVSLGQRLGEASGAAAAVPLVQAATRILRDMATFGDAGVTKADEEMVDL